MGHRMWVVENAANLAKQRHAVKEYFPNYIVGTPDRY